MKDLTFNISETSRITGLSIDTLRYYDKIDLIKSKKNPNNRYRYYTIEDISIISHIKNLRDLDLSICDIKSLLHSDQEVQRQILKNHHKVLLEKVATIKKIEKVFKDTLKEVNSSDLMINVPVIKSYTDRYFKKLKNNVKTNKCSISNNLLTLLTSLSIYSLSLFFNISTSSKSSLTVSNTNKDCGFWGSKAKLFSYKLLLLYFFISILFINILPLWGFLCLATNDNVVLLPVPFPPNIE